MKRRFFFRALAGAPLTQLRAGESAKPQALLEVHFCGCGGAMLALNGRGGYHSLDSQ